MMARPSKEGGRGVEKREGRTGENGEKGRVLVLGLRRRIFEECERDRGGGHAGGGKAHDSLSVVESLVLCPLHEKKPSIMSKEIAHALVPLLLPRVMHLHLLHMHPYTYYIADS
jgi:hypothetical protein